MQLPPVAPFACFCVNGLRGCMHAAGGGHQQSGRAGPRCRAQRERLVELDDLRLVGREGTDAARRPAPGTERRQCRMKGGGRRAVAMLSLARGVGGASSPADGELIDGRHRGRGAPIVAVRGLARGGARSFRDRASLQAAPTPGQARRPRHQQGASFYSRAAGRSSQGSNVFLRVLLLGPPTPASPQRGG